MTRIALLRHGETEWNVARRIQGQADSALTSAGVAWAKACAPLVAPLGFDVVYSSPLGRARATARLVAGDLGLEPRPEPGLMEQDFGDWTGLYIRDLEAHGLLQAQKVLGWAFHPPGGESRQEMLARIWRTLLELAERHAGGNILALTHEGVVRCVCYALLGRDYLPGEPRVLKTRTLLWLKAENGCLTIEAMNRPLAPSDSPPPGVVE